MKLLKKNRYSFLLVVIIMVLSSSCQSESDDNSKGINASTGITLNISLHEVTETQTSLRSFTTGNDSPRLDYNTLNNLNVIIYMDNEVFPYVYYFDQNTPSSIVTLPMSGGTASINIASSTHYSEIYVVANYGSAIDGTAIATPADLKSLNVTLPLNNAPDRCTMFAKAIDSGTLDPNGCKILNASLQRNMAMVTVSLNGKNLRNGVSIRPTRISIKNVPACTSLGMYDNKITDSSGLRTGYSLVDTNWPALNNVDSIIGSATHSTTGSLAFFTFENLQGSALGVTTETAKNITLKPFATYITVEAQYRYTNPITHAVITGDITYRFCLGSNVTNNYDVVHNHHYMVSLYLSDWGGAQEGGRISNNMLVVGTGAGVNWRVVMNTYDYGFSQTNYNFDAHVSTGSIPVSGSCKFLTFQYSPAINIANTSEHWILTTKANNTWVPMATGAADLIKNDKFTYFIKPWRYTDPGFPKSADDKQYRECAITIENSNGDGVQTVIFRQWAPIKITNTLYVERFDEGKTTGLSNVQWGYQGVSVLPAGFVYWTTGGADKSLGFENTVKLGATSPAAAIALKKGGYDRSSVVPSILSTQFKTAAYYLATEAEMDTVSKFTIDIFNPAYTSLDPIDVSVDYWSSSASRNGDTFYWDHNSKTRLQTTSRTAIKKSRSVYRPSKDTP